MRFKFLLAISLVNLLNFISCLDDVEYLNDIITNPAINKMTNMILPTIVKKINSGNILGFVLDGYEHENVTWECQVALGNLTQGLYRGRLSAAKFVDATAKIQSGVSKGSIEMFGSFDQCMDADFPTKRNSMFHGKYCSVLLVPERDVMKKMMNSDFPKRYEVKIRWDICLPNSCTEEDILTSIENSFRKKSIPSGFINLRIGSCQTRDLKEFSQAQIVALVMFGILGSVLVIGTLLDVVPRLKATFKKPPTEVPVFVFEKEQDSKLRRMLLSFSLYTNISVLMSTEVGEGTIRSLNGIRFLTIAWIILSHSYYYLNLDTLTNLSRVSKFPDDAAFEIIINGTVAVDAFFLLSGLLVTYTIVGELRKHGGINWGKFYFHRFWRLTPAYAAVILFAILLSQMGSGPTWKEFRAFSAYNCETRWWTSLLYITNFFKPEDSCLHHTWYLAIDMQFFVFSPIILFALYKKPVLGLFINFSVMLSSICYTAYLGYVNDYPPTMLFRDLDTSIEKYTEFFQNLYLAPYCRVGPYCVGIFVGYFLLSNKKLSLNPVLETIFWCLSAACNLSVLFGAYEWNQGHPSSTFVHTLYLSTHRTAWAIGLAWVIIACCTGNGGPVNSILSWRLFVPLARLTYTAYLVHPVLIIAQSGMTRGGEQYVEYNHVLKYLGFLSLSFIFAILTSLAAETPFLRVENVIFPKKEKPKDFINEKDTNSQVHQGVVNESFNIRL